MIKCVVFDFDGTLVDSKPVFVSIYNELAQKAGYTLMTPDNIEQLRAMSISERCAFLKMPMYRIPLFAARFLKMYNHSVPLLNFNPDIEDLLEVLSKRKLPYAILSSNSKTNIIEFFRIKGLGVKDVFCSSNIFGKDRTLAKFLISKSLKPSEILYVGDEARDVTACNKLGIKVAWVSWGYDSVDALEHTEPDYIVHSPDELLEIIDVL